eukprot:scaffold127346_cov30-Tisochrysis_lutea.AAC.1
MLALQRSGASTTSFIPPGVWRVVAAHARIARIWPQAARVLATARRPLRSPVAWEDAPHLDLGRVDNEPCGPIRLGMPRPEAQGSQGRCGSEEASNPRTSTPASRRSLLGLAFRKRKLSICASGESGGGGCGGGRGKGGGLGEGGGGGGAGNGSGGEGSGGDGDSEGDAEGGVKGTQGTAGPLCSTHMPAAYTHLRKLPRGAA